ncbi:MAG: response regulator [Chloroflexota bacterium]|nr:response regulator [Dehalococcoidia bacterium]MDW8254475.1 response regulator [Chloroflexota bacterium]
MSKTILLVDDEDLIRLLVRTTIENEEYRLLEAADGEEALEIVRREHPDLVLLDVGMPRRNGFEVVEQIKQDPATKDTIVVMLTAHGREVDRLRGLGLGADDYFTKPFSPLDLLRKIRELLGS